MFISTLDKYFNGNLICLFLPRSSQIRAAIRRKNYEQLDKQPSAQKRSKPSPSLSESTASSTNEMPVPVTLAGSTDEPPLKRQKQGKNSLLLFQKETHDGYCIKCSKLQVQNRSVFSHYQLISRIHTRKIYLFLNCVTVEMNWQQTRLSEK